MPGDLPIDALDFKHLFLQAMDGPMLAANLSAAARYCMEHPQWRLSLQAHKYVGTR
jgi:7-carboxy-7-deazaguanine synthase